MGFISILKTAGRKMREWFHIFRPADSEYLKLLNRAALVSSMLSKSSCHFLLIAQLLISFASLYICT